MAIGTEIEVGIEAGIENMERQKKVNEDIVIGKADIDDNDCKFRIGQQTHPVLKELSSLDVIDIVTKSINSCGKINNSMKIKIFNNVVKELKAFYGN
jgi:hypothetical protein